MKKMTSIEEPILFLARGHSGTSMLADLLEKAGVWMGQPWTMNATKDSLPFTFKFQRKLVPQLWSWGQGCTQGGHDDLIRRTRDKCLESVNGGNPFRHTSGHWGFKTCAGMFAHELYKVAFPKARYIYMVRNPLDVITSGDGRFHLTNHNARDEDWEYFKILTFGRTGFRYDVPEDIADLPYSGTPEIRSRLMKHKYWIQARSWVEHMEMMDHLLESNKLSLNTYLVRYEDLVTHPERELGGLFDFLEMDLKDSTVEYAKHNWHKSSIGKWKWAGLSAEIMDMVEPYRKVWEEAQGGMI